MTVVDYRDLGAKVRAARKQMKLTQEALAEQVGISASFMGHIERGTRVASLETLVSLCNVLHVTPMHLLSASLVRYDDTASDGLSPQERARLNEFLRLAQDTLSHWDD